MLSKAYKNQSVKADKSDRLMCKKIDVYCKKLDQNFDYTKLILAFSLRM